MKKTIMIGLFLTGLSVFQYVWADDHQAAKLTRLWEAKGFITPESVLPVPEKGIMYVSNIGSQNPTAKEGTGFISILNDKGEIKELKWSSGLNSPKGMAIVGQKLYVTEVDRISAIDLNTGKKIKEYPVPEATFLNDIAADDQGRLYISASRSGTVYKLAEGIVSVFIKSEDYGNVNGVVIEQNKLVVGTGSKIIKVDLESKEVTDFMTNTGAVDGIAFVKSDMVVFSDWPGKIHIMKAGKEKELILDTSEIETLQTADFGYNGDKKLIYVPTFFGNTVVCYQLEL